VRLVAVADYEAAVERARIAEGALWIVRQLARTYPRRERWRESFEALQSAAQAVAAEAGDIEEAIAKQAAARA
jgi:hypothetical protein